LRKHRLHREVREHNDKDTRFFTGCFVCETSSSYLDGVNTVDVAIWTVNVKLTLVKVEEMTVNLEMMTICST
jgi:hypothetical protein